MTRSRTKISPRRYSVRQALLWLAGACLLPGLLGAALVIGYQHRQSRQELEQQTLLTTRALVQAVDNHLLKTQAAALALSTSESLRQGNLAAFHREASHAMRLLGRDGNLVLRDVAGRQVLNTAAAFGTALTVQPEPLQVREVFESGQPTKMRFWGPSVRACCARGACRWSDFGTTWGHDLTPEQLAAHTAQFFERAGL